MQRALAAVLVLVLAASCAPASPAPDAGAPADAGRDASPPPEAGHDAGTDAALSDAGRDASDDAGRDAGPPCVGPPGLYVGDECTTLAPGVRPYHPRYGLWSDGADKERFVYLPAGATIDSSDPDRWGFPVGTRLYKTFSIGGVRIETRVLEKTAAPRGTSSWTMTSYVWAIDQRSVRPASPFGEADVHGTGHEVPSRAECVRCHSIAQDDVIVGFSAIQLAHDEAGVTLATLGAEGLLTTSIDPSSAQVPGDPTTRAALGYLHANCGNCHGGPAPEHGLDLWLRVGATDPMATATWTSAVCGCSVWTRTLPTGALANLRIAPHHPDLSVSVLRMGSRAPMDQMPPIGTSVVDAEGVRVLSDWIASLDETANGCPHGCPWP